MEAAARAESGNEGLAAGFALLACWHGTTHSAWPLKIAAAATLTGMASNWTRCLVAVGGCVALCACAAKPPADPLGTLASPSMLGGHHHRAMDALDDTAPNDPAT